MKFSGSGLPRWLKKRRVCEEFALNERRLRKLRQDGLINFRQDGNEYVYLTESLDEYFNGKIIIPDVLNPKNGDNKTVLLLKEVLRKQRERKVEKERKELQKENDNV